MKLKKRHGLSVLIATLVCVNVNAMDLSDDSMDSMTKIAPRFLVSAKPKTKPKSNRLDNMNILYHMRRVNHNFRFLHKGDKEIKSYITHINQAERKKFVTVAISIAQLFPHEQINQDALRQIFANFARVPARNYGAVLKSLKGQQIDQFERTQEVLPIISNICGTYSGNFKNMSNAAVPLSQIFKSPSEEDHKFSFFNEPNEARALECVDECIQELVASSATEVSIETDKHEVKIQHVLKCMREIRKFGGSFMHMSETIPLIGGMLKHIKEDDMAYALTEFN